jgi:hypothetical protein
MADGLGAHIAVVTAVTGATHKLVSENTVVALRDRRIRLFVGYSTVECRQTDKQTKAKKKKKCVLSRA